MNYPLNIKYCVTRGVGRILDGYANPQLRLGFAWLSRILPTPLVFISGYANTENVFYCLSITHVLQASWQKPERLFP